MSKTGENVLGRQLAEMLKGGVIMDVSNVEQAKIAEEAGASAVMALEKLPVEIRNQGGVARMSDPDMIQQIQATVTVPVMAKVRIGHSAEAQILQALKIDYVDESEVLTPADPFHHIDKTVFDVPFVCGATNLGEALRRINEGASMIRTKGEAGTGNVVEAVRNLRVVQADIEKLSRLGPQQLKRFARHERVPASLISDVRKRGRLPVVTFVAGGVATPADAALLMQMGADGVFVGSGIFHAKNPARTARAIVEATTYYQDSQKLVTLSAGLGEPMSGLDIAGLEVRMQERGQ